MGFAESDPQAQLMANARHTGSNNIPNQPLKLLVDIVTIRFLLVGEENTRTIQRWRG